MIPSVAIIGEFNPGFEPHAATNAAIAHSCAALGLCTGAFLIGIAGLLDGKRATTHWEDIADLRRLLPNTEVLENKRWVDEGSVNTSAGISAGIDMSLHLVSRLADRDLAIRTAHQMEYETYHDFS